jgi:hypothetical protein
MTNGWDEDPVEAPTVIRELGEFNFQCRAKTEGYAIEFSFTAPSAANSPDWNRDLRVLRKQGEWPQSWDDSGAYVSLAATYPTEQSVTITETGLEAGVIYYYALFQKRNDGVWVSDSDKNRCSAYPYDRWGAHDYMYSSLPRGYRSEDAGVLHLYQFLSIFGAMVDNNKTDVENLLTLFEIDNIHDDLIFLIDRKLAWPTWHATGGLQRRIETSRAVDIYKIVGREDAYESLLEEVSNWDLQVVEGWKYVMFSNGRFNTTTPDFTDPNLLLLKGRIGDVLRYTPDTQGWHSVTGLGFFLFQIPGVSGPLTSTMIERIEELIEEFKASYVTVGLTVVTAEEEIVPLSSFIDTYFDAIEGLHSESMSTPLEEDLGYTTTSWNLFESNDLTSTTNTIDDRVFHTEIEYL